MTQCCCPVQTLGSLRIPLCLVRKACLAAESLGTWLALENEDWDIDVKLDPTVETVFLDPLRRRVYLSPLLNGFSERGWKAHAYGHFHMGHRTFCQYRLGDPSPLCQEAVIFAAYLLVSPMVAKAVREGTISPKFAAYACCTDENLIALRLQLMEPPPREAVLDFHLAGPYAFG